MPIDVTSWATQYYAVVLDASTGRVLMEAMNGLNEGTWPARLAAG